jgi:hypothetical protein
VQPLWISDLRSPIARMDRQGLPRSRAEGGSRSWLSVSVHSRHRGRMNGPQTAAQLASSMSLHAIRSGEGSEEAGEEEIGAHLPMANVDGDRDFNASPVPPLPKPPAH